MSIQARLSLATGKYSHLPNVVLVAKRKTFPVNLQLDTECPFTHVVGAADKAQARVWCVLDERLRQVMVGVGNTKESASRGMHPHVARTVMGGGASNPEQLTVDMTSAKLKNGASYTFIYKSHGVTAACDFVALDEASKAPARRKIAKKRVKKAARAVKKKAKAKKRLGGKKAR